MKTCENCGMDLQVALIYAKSFLRSKSFPETNKYWKNFKDCIENGKCPCKKAEDEIIDVNPKYNKKTKMYETTIRLNPLREVKNKKGCGEYLGFFCGEKGKDGYIILCQSCSGNHTRSKGKCDEEHSQLPVLVEKEPDVLDKPASSGSDFDLSKNKAGTHLKDYYRLDGEHGCNDKVMTWFYHEEDIKTFIKINKMHSSNAEFYNPKEKVIPLRVFIKLCGEGLR